MGVATSLKRSALEDAWDDASAQSLTLREVLRTNERTARKAVAGGSLSSVSANNRRSDFAPYGAGNITPVQAVEMWRELIDAFDEGKKWLLFCGKKGVSAFAAELEANQQTDPETPIDPPLTITDFRWTELCQQFDISEATIVNQKVNDDTVAMWMLYHLFPVTEARSDYGDMRVGRIGVI